MACILIFEEERYLPHLRQECFGVFTFEVRTLGEGGVRPSRTTQGRLHGVVTMVQPQMRTRESQKLQKWSQASVQSLKISC